jgi:hypothetical protein
MQKLRPGVVGAIGCSDPCEEVNDFRRLGCLPTGGCLLDAASAKSSLRFTNCGELKPAVVCARYLTGECVVSATEQGISPLARI